jgi:hypothetical protein
MARTAWVRACVAAVSALLLSACGTYRLEAAPATEDAASSPTPTATATPTATPTASPSGGTDASTVVHRSPSVRVSFATLVVNDDGSATVAAYLENVSDDQVVLLGMTVTSGADELPVTTTEMLLPIPSGDEVHVGDATDAGGFVVPAGVEAGATHRIVLGFDDGTCVAVETEAVERGSEHRGIHPVVGEIRGGVASTTGPCPADG